MFSPGSHTHLCILRKERQLPILLTSREWWNRSLPDCPLGGSECQDQCGPPCSSSVRWQNFRRRRVTPVLPDLRRIVVSGKTTAPMPDVPPPSPNTHRLVLPRSADHWGSATWVGVIREWETAHDRQPSHLWSVSEQLPREARPPRMRSHRESSSRPHLVF